MIGNKTRVLTREGWRFLDKLSGESTEIAATDSFGNITFVRIIKKMDGWYRDKESNEQD